MANHLLFLRTLDWKRLNHFVTPAHPSSLVPGNSSVIAELRYLYEHSGYKNELVQNKMGAPLTKRVLAEGGGEVFTNLV